MKKVVMYKKKVCPYCVQAENYLRAKGVSEIEFIDIELNPSKREEMISKSKGKMTVPQIFIDEEHIGGCDELHALSSAKLDELLGK
jgi:glutaredoxin 3